MFFKCVRSGRTMEVTNPDNIVQMRNNESYVIVEVSAHSQGDSDGLRKETEEVPIKNADAPPKVKKLGRPRKVAPAAAASQEPAAATQDWV